MYFPVVLAGTALIKVGKNYDQQTINLVVGDSIVWEFHDNLERSVTQVASKDSCQKLQDGFDSGPIVTKNGSYYAHYYNTFHKSGLYFYASTVNGDCQAGFRGIVNVVDLPVNQFAQSWQAKEQQQKLVKRSQETKNSANIASISMALLLNLL